MSKRKLVSFFSMIVFLIFTTYLFKNEIVSYATKSYFLYTKKNYLLVGISSKNNGISTNTFDIHVSLSLLGNIPAKDVFVSIYEAESGRGVYEYSILRTDKNGSIDFVLNKGEYDVVLATSPDSGLGELNNQFFFIHDHISVAKSENIETCIGLSEATIQLTGFPFTTPRMKLEATSQAKYGRTAPHNFATKEVGDNQVKISFSGNDVAINFDQLLFDDNNLYTLVLGFMHIKNNEIYEVRFDQLEKYSVTMKDTKAGWFKVEVNDHYGDFQGKFYQGFPISIYTNLEKLHIYMVYIPLAQCVNQLSQLSEFATRRNEILEACIDSDVRYDFADVPIKKGELLLLDPPSALILLPEKQRLVQGDRLKIGYRIETNQGYEISRLFIHQLWNMRIMPKLYIKNSTGSVVMEEDLFDDRYREENLGEFDQRICLPSGNYVAEVEMPIGTWGGGELVGTFDLRVDPGDGCQIVHQEDDFKSLKKFTSWQELYEDRGQLFTASSGFRLTFPSYPNENILNVDKKVVAAQSCEELRTINDKSIILIKLNEALVYDLNREREFSLCLRDYSQSHTGGVYVLDGSFFGDRTFPTINWYIYYYYYLAIKQSADSFVGINVRGFYDMFFGFPDFYLVDFQNNRQIFPYADFMTNEDNFNKILFRNYEVSPVRIIWNTTRDN